jgi:gliding motility-associated-like protein
MEKRKVNYFKAILTLIISILFPYSIQAQQPEPCVNPAMTPTCGEACVICDIDGFSGINNSTVVSPMPPGFCTTQAHNITWIAFVAGSVNLTLEVAVSNCQTGLGLEIGIYETLDCVNMQQVSNCNTDIPNNTSATFSNTLPLVVGQYYYFVMDGSDGDICNYQVTVTEGTTEIGALTAVNEILGPDTACPGVTQNFEVEEVIGANFTDWYLNGLLIDSQSEILEHTWGEEEGTFQLCYNAYNVCDTIPQICKTIIVESIPDIAYIEDICTDDCFYVPEVDTTICEPGFHTLTQITDVGCTSEVTLDLTITPPVYTPITLEFCFGDTVFIGNAPFTQTGNYEISLDGIIACDSIIQLDLTTFLCDIEGGFDDDNLLCNGGSDGTLEFNLVDGVFPYTFAWSEVTEGLLSGNGISDNISGQILIPNLTEGIYSITVSDASGSMGIFVGQVYEPNPVLVQFDYSNYNGYGVSCLDTDDGTINMTPSGGTPPYSIIWNNGETTAMINSLRAGTYPVSITDNNDCEVIFMPSLSAPDSMISNLTITNPGCNPDDSGIIAVSSINGGVAPYLYDFDLNGFSSDSSYNNLFSGDYQVAVLDDNGCLTETNATIIEPNVLVMTLGQDLLIFLGDSVQITPFTNLNSAAFEWEYEVGISCLDCREPFLRPFETTTYIATATMSNGCTQRDSVTIFVEKRRNFFVPNAFSPNADGANDILQLFGGLEVSHVIDFHLFSRWGELIYLQKNLPINNFNYGWDGTFNGKNAQEGVYVWTATVVFLDGEILRFNGDVTLIR